jgi:hypothetical protein
VGGPDLLLFLPRLERQSGAERPELAEGRARVVRVNDWGGERAGKGEQDESAGGASHVLPPILFRPDLSGEECPRVASLILPHHPGEGSANKGRGRRRAVKRDAGRGLVAAPLQDCYCWPSTTSAG